MTNEVIKVFQVVWQPSFGGTWNTHDLTLVRGNTSGGGSNPYYTETNVFDNYDTTVTSLGSDFRFTDLSNYDAYIVGEILNEEDSLQTVIDTLKLLFPVDPKLLRMWYVDATNSNVYVKHVGEEWTGLEAHMLNINDEFILYVEFALIDADDNTELAPIVNYCGQGLWLVWDTINDTVDVTNGGVWSEEIATGIVDNNSMKALLESIYPYGNFEWAINTSTGVVCVRYIGVSSSGSNFSYSVTLEEEINLGDEAEAFIVSRYPVNGDGWL